MDSRKFVERTSALEVDFGDGDVIKLTYRPNVITTDEAISENGTPEENVEQAARLIATWDLTEDEQPVPLTRKALGAQPATIVGRVMSAILEDMRVPQARASS